ncbi:MAG: adenylate/guanylate cyclase domain-containing protein, partial [Gemmatimonadota bacterium]|nr:adenylate/guanylate cyclase domain-containing protein [Gemmatimonadota bacterium]
EKALAGALEIIQRLVQPSWKACLYRYTGHREFLVPVAGQPETAGLGLALPRGRDKMRELTIKSASRLQVIDLDKTTGSDCWASFLHLNRAILDVFRVRLIVPLSDGKQLFGIILLAPEGNPAGRKTPRPRQLELIARQLILGLARFKDLQSLKSSRFEIKLKKFELETLQDVGIAISSTLDLDQLTRELLLKTVSVLNVNSAIVLLGNTLESGTGHGNGSGNGVEPMRVVETFGMEEAHGDCLSSLGSHTRITGNIVKGLPTILNDPASVPDVFKCRKIMIVPVRFKDELLGAIVVGDKEGRSMKYPDFDQADLNLLSAMANQAGAAISNARLYHSVLKIKNYNENILLSIASGVITTDTEGRVESFNDSAAKIFNLSKSRAKGMKLEELFVSQGLSSLAQRLAETQAECKTYQETNLHTGNQAGGEEVVFNISATPLGRTGKDESRGAGGMVVSVENISERARVHSMLKRYVSANVVDMVLEKGHELALGGKLCEVTILFADIRGFTRLSEENTPEQVVELLNSYFDLMIDVVFRYNGTVDKIVGDEIMVLFGAPFSLEDDTRRAVGCALAMLKALEMFNTRRKKSGKFPLAIGIGLNRGPVISGNIGSTRHMDYTVIGDAVNLASRIVDHAAAGQILITRSVKEALDGYYACRSIQTIQVKGKKKPVEVFEIPV